MAPQVGGCSFMLHVRHAVAAINEGLCETVLITHGESGRSEHWSSPDWRGGRAIRLLAGQFEAPFGGMGPHHDSFTIPVPALHEGNGHYSGATGQRWPWFSANGQR